MLYSSSLYRTIWISYQPLKYAKAKDRGLIYSSETSKIIHYGVKRKPNYVHNLTGHGISSQFAWLHSWLFELTILIS